LTPSKYNLFLTSFLQFLKKIEPAAQKSVLSYFALQFGAPGIIDLYQGGEIENLRLVDPDNRSTVDFSLREKMIKEAKSEKLMLITKCGRFRSSHPALFLEGEYTPLETTSDQVVGYIRNLKKETLIVIARRFFFDKTLKGDVHFPKSLLKCSFQELLSQKEFCFEKEKIRVKELLKDQSTLWLYAKK
jgi:maltooligosyltrehalose synthase